jgi:hypothetical protein
MADNRLCKNPKEYKIIVLYNAVFHKAKWLQVTPNTGYLFATPNLTRQKNILIVKKNK